MSTDQPPYILCIETSTDVCSVGLGQGTQLISEEIDRAGGRRHAALLPSMIDPVLNRAGIELKQIDAVAYSKGPGSYTGLRVGLSTAKGICLALQKPLIGVSTLLALCHSIEHVDPSAWILGMIDAGRDEVYYAGYDALFQEVITAQPLILTRNSGEQWLASGRHIYIVGDGSLKAEKLLEPHPHLHFGSAEVLARYLIKPGLDQFINKNFENLAYAVPDYLKAPAYKKSM